MSPAPTPRRGGVSLLEKYAPRTIAELVGQPAVVDHLQQFLADPHPVAFLFEGETGVGKTCAAKALAAGLGVDVDQHTRGGLHTIASGEATAEAVRDAATALSFWPWSGSGWRALIVNEADLMSTAAAALWLDLLEALPAKTVVVFTTNAPQRLPQRLRDRCECVEFESRAEVLLPALQAFAARVWRAETGEADCPPVSEFGPVVDERGHASVRRLLTFMTAWARSWRERTAASATSQGGGST